MWFRRMPLEEWFDRYQYAIKYDIGESAVKYHVLHELNIDLGAVPLRYGYHMGRPDLRELIAGQYEGLSVEDIIVTSACSEAIFAFNAAILRPGDHAVIEHPTYPSLYEIPRSLGCEVSLLTLEFENEFLPDIERLKSLITPKTKYLNLTHPNNPTGSVISRNILEQVISLAEERDLYLLVDETYRDLSYDRPLPAAASLSRKAISISSMSKCYGLPGIRIGWLAAQDREIVRRVLAVREQVTIANNALSEEIAVSVLQKRREFLDRAKKHLQANLEVVSSWMEKRRELEWILPRAGVVSFPRIKSAGIREPEKLFRLLVEKFQTFVVPGRCFEMDNRFFRLGFGGEREEIESGLANLAKAIEETD